jgi:prepilin-type processing-associated H-X9-DG protein
MAELIVDTTAGDCRDCILAYAPSLRLLEEDEKSINDGFFVVSMDGSPYEANGKAGSSTLNDFPASYHNRAGGFSFADGHSEIHRWTDSRTMPPIKPLVTPAASSATDNKDDRWMQEHSTRLK